MAALAILGLTGNSDIPTSPSGRSYFFKRMEILASPLLQVGGVIASFMYNCFLHNLCSLNFIKFREVGICATRVVITSSDSQQVRALSILSLLNYFSRSKKVCSIDSGRPLVLLQVKNRFEASKFKVILNKLFIIEYIIINDIEKYLINKYLRNLVLFFCSFDANRINKHEVFKFLLTSFMHNLSIFSVT